MHKLLLLIIPLVASCTTSPFYNFQGSDTTAIQREIHATKISDDNDAFSVYRINEVNIGIVNPALKTTGSLRSGNPLTEVASATILSKDQVDTLSQSLRAILASYDEKNKTDNRTIDFFLLEKEVSTQIQTVAFGSSGSSRGEAEVVNGQRVLFRIQYSFTKGLLSPTEQTLCYSRGLGPYVESPIVQYADLKNLLENLTR